MDLAVSYDEMIQELNREISTRIRVYPDWISKGKIKQSVAEHRLECMQLALLILSENKPKLQKNGQISLDLWSR